MLEAKQLKAIELFFKDVPKTTIANEVGVSRITLYRWFENDEFKQAIKERALNEFKLVLPEMTSNLINLARKSKSDYVRLQATQDILDRVGVTEEQASTDNAVDIAEVIKVALVDDENSTQQETDAID